MKHRFGIVALLSLLLVMLLAVSAQAATCSHSSTKYVTTKAATCCTAGTRKKVCKSCGKVLQTGLTVKATGKHANVTARVAVSPKCTKAGKLNLYCASSGKLVQTKTINALGHNVKHVQTRSATCTARGYKKYACTRCDYVNTVYTTAKLGHNPKLISSKAATCTKDGYKQYKCSRCTYAYKDTIAKKGHTPVLKTVVAATCCYKGYKDQVCNVCKTVLKQEAEIIPATHKHASTYSEIEIEPTCTSYGKEIVYCGTYNRPCQEIQKKLAHDYQYSSEKAATCTTDGYTVFKCTMCGGTTKVPMEAGCSKTKYEHRWYQYENTTGDLGYVESRKFCPDCGEVFDTMTTQNVSYDDFKANWQSKRF